MIWAPAPLIIMKELFMNDLSLYHLIISGAYIDNTERNKLGALISFAPSTRSF
jgi:hypothetical protein